MPMKTNNFQAWLLWRAAGYTVGSVGWTPDYGARGRDAERPGKSTHNNIRKVNFKYVAVSVISLVCFLENFDMKDDEITLEGFLELNTMEAQDADGDPNDLWVTLENMGYNKALELDQVLFSGESSQKRASRALKQPRHRVRQ